MSRITLKTISTSIDKLARSVAKGFDEVHNRLNKLEIGQTETNGRLNKLEKGQEDILLKLDNKADKIDFPNVYKQFRRNQ